MSEFGNIDELIKQAEEIGKDAAESFNEGWLEYLIKADTATVRAFNTRYEALKYQRDFGLISADDYYRMLEEARDYYFTRNTQEWYKYTQEIYDYRVSKIDEYNEYVKECQEAEEKLRKEAEEKLRKTYYEMFDSISSALDGIEKQGTKAFTQIQKQQQNYKDKLMDYAGSPTGFDTRVTWVDNYWPTGDPLKMVDYSLVDYEKEIQKLREFNDAITALKERAGEIDGDVFSMFFDELRGMSVDDAKILTDLLLKASDEDFARHFELYGEKNALAENMSTSYYADDYNKLALQLSEELEKVFGELPEEFFEYGKKLGEEFSFGFVEQINEFFREITVDTPYIEPSEGTTNVQNTEFSPTYYFYGDRSTTSRTRINAKNDALYGFMRGMF